MPLVLQLHVLAAVDRQAIKVLRSGGLARGERDLATLGQPEAIMLRAAAHFLNDAFGLRSGGAVRLAADNWKLGPLLGHRETIEAAASSWR